MHQYKTIAQTFFVLSILNLVFAAPVVPREAYGTLTDVGAEDVTKTRREMPEPGGTTPSQNPSLPPLDGSPTTPLPAVGEAPSRSPTTEPSTSAHPLSTAGEPGLGPGVSTSSRPSESFATDRPVFVPAGSTAGGSTTMTYAQITHDMVSKDPKWYQKPAVKKTAGFALMAAIFASFVAFSALNGKHHKDD